MARSKNCSNPNELYSGKNNTTRHLWLSILDPENLEILRIVQNLFTGSNPHTSAAAREAFHLNLIPAVLLWLALSQAVQIPGKRTTRLHLRAWRRK